jgi:hypothetical protein
MKGLTKTIELDGLAIICRELNWNEIQLWERELEAGIKKGGTTAADMMLMENFSPSDLLRMTDLTPEKLGELAPSEMEQVYQGCLEVNQRFFALRVQVLGPLKQAIEYFGLMRQQADSSDSDTRVSRIIRGLSTWMRFKK